MVKILKDKNTQSHTLSRFIAGPSAATKKAASFLCEQKRLIPGG
jgi:hypothetical protein